MPKAPDPARTISFQGASGAYSDLACRHVFPEMATLPCNQFEDAFAAVREGRARLAMIPIENSLAGRVADIHHLMPDSGLHIIGEHFEPVNHHLLALPGARLAPNPHGQEPCPRALAVPQADPRTRARADRRRRHRRGRGRNLRPRRPDRRRNRLRARRQDLRPRLAQREYRGRRAQHDALHDHVARGSAAGARGAFGHDVLLSRAQRAGSTLQGAGRVRHQRHQHDQARKLHGRRPLYRDAVLCRCRSPPRGSPVELALEELAFFSRELKILGVYPAHPSRLAASAGVE